jgi:methionyl-tRNA formyltransferase
MQMDAGLDTGDILLKKTCTIETQETAETLHDKLANLGAEAIFEALVELEQGKLNPMPQDNSLTTYAAKLNKEDARIDWNRDADEIERDIRAYNPYPGASSLINNTQVKIWQTKVNKENGRTSGEVIEVKKNVLVVACGKGSLSIEILQRPNSKAMSAGDFLQGFQIKAGDRFSLS